MEIQTPSKVDRVELISGADIQVIPIAWLWDGYLAAKKLHVIGGSPGTGKTTIATSLAATLSVGGHWPDGSRAPVRNVIVWSGEDGYDDTWVPRLMAAGADLSRIRFISGIVARSGQKQSFDPAVHVALLVEAIEMLGDVGLVILDPVSSVIAGDSHKNSEVRRGLERLVSVAEEANAAILGVHHLTKGTQGGDPVERLTGSLAFGAVPRVVLCTAKMAAQDGTGRIVRAKSNIGLDGGGFDYSLLLANVTNGIEAQYIGWGRPLVGSARQLLNEAEGNGANDSESQTELERAMALVHSALSNGPMASSDLLAAAAAVGISKKTLKRARAQLKVKPVKTGMNGGWMSALPDWQSH